MGKYVDITLKQKSNYQNCNHHFDDNMIPKVKKWKFVESSVRDESSHVTFYVFSENY